MRRAMICGCCMLALAACAPRPAFVPKPSRAYEQFTALRELRRSMPVGALWVEGHGPYGEGAAADNLVTEPGLSGVTFDNDFRATFTAGFLQLLDLDPSFRSKVTARFNDLTVVRIKDMSKLANPGHPHIYAALKAATITITAVNDMGLDIEGRITSRDIEVIGRGSTGQARTFTIDAKDMYLAIQVADFQEVESETKQINLRAGKPAAFSQLGVSIPFTFDRVASADACNVRAQVALLDPVALKTGEPVKVPLPVPVAHDGRLYTDVRMELFAGGLASGCDRMQVRAALIGTQTQLRQAGAVQSLN